MRKSHQLGQPTSLYVRSRIKDESGKKLYKGIVLKNYSTEVLEKCQHQALRDLKLLEQNMRERLEWSDVKLMRNILVFIDTQGWQKKASLITSTIVMLLKVNQTMQMMMVLLKLHQLCFCF